MEFWKKHTKCRIILMAALFIAGISLSVFGWGMTGKIDRFRNYAYWNYLFINGMWIYNCLLQKRRKEVIYG